MQQNSVGGSVLICQEPVKSPRIQRGMGRNPQDGIAALDSVLICALALIVVFLVSGSNYPRSGKPMVAFAEPTNIQIGDKRGLMQGVTPHSGLIHDTSDVRVLLSFGNNRYCWPVGRCGGVSPSVVVDAVGRWTTWNNRHRMVGKVFLSGPTHSLSDLITISLRGFYPIPFNPDKSGRMTSIYQAIDQSDGSHSPPILQRKISFYGYSFGCVKANPGSLANLELCSGQFNRILSFLDLFFGIVGIESGDTNDGNSTNSLNPRWQTYVLFLIAFCLCGCGFLVILFGLAYGDAGYWRWYKVLACCIAGICLIGAGWKLIHIALSSLENKNASVSQKHLTSDYLCNTLIAMRRFDMANVLPKDKQIAVVSALCEGSGIRQIERITGIHRDTIMRLGVKVGEGCAAVLDQKMRDLSCQYLQFDELWGFIGKKQRNLRVDDDPQYGDVWTFCAIDSDTKLVPSFKVGKRDSETANAFVKDLAGRMKTRVQVSTDALRAYVEAVEQGFGANADYGQVVKTYLHDESQHPERKYSAPEIVTTEKKAISGLPDMALVSTSHIERLNGTTRLHMRRLTRLTYAFSKKLENFEAAVALHFTYYNFVKRHSTIRMTPAMAAGIEQDFWTVGDLIEAAA